MPIVHVVTTGGTIASRVDPATGAAVPVAGPDELVALVPELARHAELRASEFCRVASWNVTAAMMADLARAVGSLLAAPDVDGVVVTHGTDTLEETAFALDLVLDGDKPVVLTGAMRNLSAPGSDAPRNLLAAVRVAADPGARGLGVVVVLNDQIHAAREVHKTHTTALDAFRSRRGPVGLVDDLGVWLRARPRRGVRLSLAEPAPRVYLVKMAADMDDLLLRAALEAGARGVVIEGSGSGNVSGAWEGAIGALVRGGVPVVLVSRCGDGRVVPTYGGPGGGRTLASLGVIPGGALSGPAARLALMFALGAGLGPDAVRDFFARLAGAEG